MTPPSEKLAGSLDLLRALQERGVVAVRSADLARSHRERLVRHGFLVPVMVACPARFFRQHAVDARTALALVRDASELLPRLLDGGHGTVAGRLAFRDVGRDRVANDIVASSTAFPVRPAAPRTSNPCSPGSRTPT